MSDKQVDVVAIGPHPDDTELGVGGTLAKLAQNGVSAGIIDLTNAEPTPLNEKYRSPDDFDPDYDSVRLNEAKEAARILGIERITLDLPNRRLFDTFEARCKVATVFRQWKPKMVIVMYGRTIGASPDHYQAQLIVEAAMFYSRLTKWDKYFEGLPVHRIQKLLYFPTRWVDFHPENYTSFFSPFSEDIAKKKMDAILAYKSQFEDQGHTHFPEVILSWNKQMGSRVGAPYAEHLVSPRPLTVDDLESFVG